MRMWSESGSPLPYFTRDLLRNAALRRTSSGRDLHINSQTAGRHVDVPFGGVKSSGWGPHEQGRAAMEFYTEPVTVYQDAPLG